MQSVVEFEAWVGVGWGGGAVGSPGKDRSYASSLYRHTQVKAVGLFSDITSILQCQAHLVGAHGARVVQVELSEDGLQGEEQPKSKSDTTLPIIGSALACSVTMLPLLSHTVVTDVMRNKMWSHQPLPDLVPQDLELQQTEPGAAILLSTS